MANIRKLTADDVTFELTIEPCDHDMDFDSGEPEADTALRADLNRRLFRGDLWAWCDVRVVARWNLVSTSHKGVDYLGGCSYRNEADFKKDGYYEDMCERALADLNEGLERSWQVLQKLVA